MVDSPVPTVLYTILYLIIVFVGPKVMKHRKPFQLTWALIPYNLSMALLNLYIAIEVSSFLVTKSYKALCCRHSSQQIFFRNIGVKYKMDVSGWKPH